MLLRRRGFRPTLQEWALHLNDGAANLAFNLSAAASDDWLSGAALVC
jgi:hypothetical protein